MDIVIDKIHIRNATTSDSKDLLKWWNDGKVMGHAGFPNGLGTNLDEINKKINKGNDENGRILIIEYDGKSIGEMNYWKKGKGIAEIGIKICESNYREKGLGRIILSVFIKELYAMGFSLIVLDTNLNNTRAQHVYELLGFEKLRVNTDSFKDQLGNFQSTVDYELKKENFHDYSTN